MLWTCPATAWNGTYPMHRVADGQPLYEADVATGLECPAPADGGPTIVTVQVRVKARHCIVNISTRPVSAAVTTASRRCTCAHLAAHSYSHWDLLVFGSQA